MTFTPSDSKPYQFLEARPGYVPVYIRFGNQPLIEINPLLAKAFREQDLISSKTTDVRFYCNFKIEFNIDFFSAA